MPRASLTEVQRAVLLTLAEGGRLSVRELGRRMGWTSSMTPMRHLSRLAAMRLVERCGDAPVQAGYRLADGVVVGRRGFVGRWVR